MVTWDAMRNFLLRHAYVQVLHNLFNVANNKQ
jgi:hypothetical protein